VKVHLIKIQSVERFVKENAQSKKAFEIWLSIIKRADWNAPQDIIRTFNSADILGQGSSRVVLILGATNTGLSANIILGNKKRTCL
jgi:mRNA interferase HigB